MRERFSQIAATFNATRERDPRMVPVMLAWAGGILAGFVVLGVLTGRVLLFPTVGVLLALAAAIIVLGRRAQAAAMAQLEGQPGAAAAVLQTMRGAWRVTPAIAFNRKQDLVHLVVGRPGVILVAEGSSPARLKQMLAKERRRASRAAGDVPVTEVMVGDGDGQVALQRLAVHLARLPRSMKAREVGPLDRKLGALQPDEPPLPKGPMPRGPRRR